MTAPPQRRLARVLASPRLPWLLVAVTTLLLAPSLRIGLVVDDWVIRSVELGYGGGAASMGPIDLFHFTSGDPAEIRALEEAGVLPWFASPHLRLAFFRPLAGASHWLDFHLFARSIAAMHAESILLHAAVLLVAWALYRRLLGARWAAGLAALMYALDPGHALSAGWIASRNAVLAAFFGLASIYAHDRARRGGERAYAFVAPAALACALASGESGLGAVAYLVAHAATLEPPGLARRARALAPHAVVVALWAVAYRAGGYGAAHSAMYLDPLHDPLGYARFALVTVPLNLGGRLGAVPPVGLAFFFARSTWPILGSVAAAFVAFAVLASWTSLRTDAVVRFLALGAVGAVLPIAATLPNDRNLFFVGFGALGLCAVIVRLAVEAKGIARRVFASWLVFVNVAIALVAFPVNAVSMLQFARLSRDPLDAILRDDGVRAETAIFVNPPAPFFTSHLGAMRAGTGVPAPAALRALAPGIYGMRIRRVASNTIELHVGGGGMLAAPGTSLSTIGPTPAMSVAYPMQYLTAFVRGPEDPMRAGETVTLRGMTATVLAVTEEGSPTDVAFAFDRPLDDPTLKFFAWQGTGYVPFAPPPLGADVELPPTTLPL